MANKALIKPEKSDFNKLDWKKAPYAYIKNYESHDMPHHSGRLEWSGYTTCCDEEVKGGDYGNDEECPCCKKPVEWSLNAKAEYAKPFLETAEKEYQEALAEYNKAYPVIIESLAEGLDASQRTDMIAFARKITEETGDISSIANIHNDDIRLEVDALEKAPFTTERVRIGFYYQHPTIRNATTFCDVTLRKNGVCVKRQDYYEEPFRTPDGDVGFNSFPTYHSKQIFEYESPFIKKALASFDTPERLSKREARYNKNVAYENLEEKIAEWDQSKPETFADMISAWKNYQKICSGYGFANVVESAFNKQNFVAFEKDDENWKVLEYRKVQDTLEDGTKGYRFTNPRSLMSGKVISGMEEIPDVLTVGHEWRGKTPETFYSNISEWMEHIVDDEPANHEFEGSRAFYCDEYMTQLYNIDTEDEEEMEEFFTVDRWMEAFKENGELCVYYVDSDGDCYDLNLTPTEKEYLSGLLGDDIPELNLNREDDE